VTRTLLFVALVAPAVAAAQPQRYNDRAPPPSRSSLVTRIVALAAGVAKEQQRPALVSDARLDAAAAAIARALPERGPPSHELVQGAMWLEGIVDPTPHLILATIGGDGERQLLQELPGDLGPALAQGRYGRLGVGLLTTGAETRVVVALQEWLVDLEPVARAFARDATVTLRGRLHAGYSAPEAFVTAPDGKVLTRMRMQGRGAAFDGSFRCGPESGRYQVEVTAAGRFGETVLANFPIWCGVPAARSLRELVPVADADDGGGSPAQAERKVWTLLNADRARAGLPALAWDDALAAVARGHSADMAAHGFFGHLSPTTGAAADRVRKAGIDAMVVMENLARAFSPGEAERSLMSSPGHRANILNREATRVGIGVVADPRAPGLLVTQLFSRPPEPFAAGTIGELRKQLAKVRAGKRRPPLEPDDALDQLAQTTARAVARREMSTALAGRRIDDALDKSGDHWGQGRTIFAIGSEVAQIGGSLGDVLADPSVTHVGLGVEPTKRPDGGSAVQVVIILATKR
jgi:uncharacterized protein YkwD